MLSALGLASLDALVDATVPAAIRLRRPLRLPEPRGEHELIDDLREVAVAQPGLPLVHRHGVLRLHHAAGDPAERAREPGLVHAVHARTRRRSPRAGWRRCSTSRPWSRTSPACRWPTPRCSTKAPPPPRRWRCARRWPATKRRRFLAAADCHPQTIAVVQTRARSLGIEVVVGRPRTAWRSRRTTFGVLLQYPTTDGRVIDYAPLAERAHAAGALVVVAADLLALTLLRPPGRVRGRHRRRLDAALRRAAGLRRAARRVPVHPRRPQAPDAGPARRRLQGPRRAARVPPGPADPRAAHPPRQGHEQHLHRAGAAGHHGQHVRASTTGPTACARSRRGSTRWPRAWPRG